MVNCYSWFVIGDPDSYREWLVAFNGWRLTFDLLQLIIDNW
jgi:hypothetical protein